jgi:mannose-6-phosphate isomerase-like protein (cupin superfamily)
MKTGKVWGTTETVIATPLFEAHRLSILANAKCSLHVHKKKWNAFVVLSGRLYVDVKKNDYDLVDTTQLDPGEMTTVPPGEYHRFRTGESGCEGYEFYYLSPLDSDIERKDVGSRKK